MNAPRKTHQLPVKEKPADVISKNDAQSLPGADVCTDTDRPLGNRLVPYSPYVKGNTMKLTNLINGLKLNKEARAELDRVLALPEVEAVMGREDEKALEHRRALIEQMATAPTRHAKAIKEASQEYAAAVEAIEKAKESLFDARVNLIAKQASALAADNAESTEILAITRELHDGRDLRLDDMHLEIARLDDKVRNTLTVWTVSEITGFGRRDARRSNMDDVLAARKVLSECDSEVKKLALSASSRADITLRLKDICQTIQTSLNPLEMAAPSIDEKDEVKEPKPYRSIHQQQEPELAAKLSHFVS